MLPSHLLGLHSFLRHRTLGPCCVDCIDVVLEFSSGLDFVFVKSESPSQQNLSVIYGRRLRD